MVRALQTQPKNFPKNKLRYRYVMDIVEQNIKSGKYLPGDKLPPIKQLAEELEVNFLTVRKGLLELTDKGLLEMKQGIGTFVSQKPFQMENKTIKIVLACRKYMLEVTQHHPAIGAYLAGAHRRCPMPEYMVQPMFYREHKFVQDVGNTLLFNEIDGVIITGGGLKTSDYEFLKSNNVATVIIGVADGEFEDWVFSVGMDNEAVLRQAVEHLRNLGHKRIGYISYKYTASTAGAVHRVFADIAFDHQLGNPNELTVFVSNPQGRPHWEDVESFFDITPQPTGVIVADEFIADILLASCERRGIKVPDELSIIVQHDLLPFSHRIPLTGIDGIGHTSEMIYRACDMLVRSIKGESLLKRHLTLTPRLIVKASTGLAK